MKKQYWEVWQGDSLVCSREMKLTKEEAENKVENERRMGWIMEARPAGPKEKMGVLY